jgi:hypothetical protein
LVRPDLDLTNLTLPMDQFFNANDLSARPNPDGSGMIANSLADLTRRENRFAHIRRDSTNPGMFFPYPLNPDWLVTKFGPFLGEDVILGDLRAFDVRVYDPQAPLDLSGAAVNVALVPGDPGYVVPPASPARGAYVDLNYAGDNSQLWTISHFSGPPHPWRWVGQRRLWSEFPQTPMDGLPAHIYDTWPSHYERDGIDQDQDNAIDEGTNGLDDDNVNGVDDAGERETAAPYGVPLRGIQVSIRIMDYSTRQVRQWRMAPRPKNPGICLRRAAPKCQVTGAMR